MAKQRRAKATSAKAIKTRRAQARRQRARRARVRRQAAHTRELAAATTPPRALPRPLLDIAVPHGRDIGGIGINECHRALTDHGVSFAAIDSADTNTLVRLDGAINGVTFVARNRNPFHRILDCRLAVALLVWSKILRRAGVYRVEHYSTYRPGARVESTGKPSGHARALAMDAARFYLENGSVLDVLTDWGDRRHGSPTCMRRDDEAETAAILRAMVCDAVSQDLFQVVLTPHHDAAHQNHVHLEVVPSVAWSVVE